MISEDFKYSGGVGREHAGRSKNSELDQDCFPDSIFKSRERVMCAISEGRQSLAVEMSKSQMMSAAYNNVIDLLRITINDYKDQYGKMYTNQPYKCKFIYRIPQITPYENAGVVAGANKFVEELAGRTKSQNHEHLSSVSSAYLITNIKANLITDRLNYLVEDARSLFSSSTGRYFKHRIYKELTATFNAFFNALAELEGTARALDVDRKNILQKKNDEIDDIRESVDLELESAIKEMVEKIPNLPVGMQAWDAPHWKDWSPGNASDLILLGYLVSNSDDTILAHQNFGCSVQVPLYLPTRGHGLRFIYTKDLRDKAIQMARSLLVRILTTVEPGKAQFNIFDPVGFGSSVANILELGEFNSELIGGKVWSSNSDLSAMLSAQTDHIELVIQKYLRNNFDSIDEFNEEAGEIAEPYRFLTIFDFPSGFSEEAIISLSRIMSVGPRCGIYTLLFQNSELTPPIGVDLDILPKELVSLNMNLPIVDDKYGYHLSMQLLPDSDLNIGQDTMNEIVEKIGRSANEAEEIVVSFKKTMELFFDFAFRGTRLGLPKLTADIDVEDANTWWSCDSIGSICAPLGQSGARDVAVLSFDSTEHAGALLVGRPGSGKSTLIHTFLAGATTFYGPDELELYLIDFKEGVEFKSYATHSLPHAKCVAVESDREFGLSVLRSLDAEIIRRGELLRSSGGQYSGLETLRRSTNEKLPRILLVFDEFQVLFSKNDKVGIEAANLLENVIRQGRGFGVHVLLGSQSLSGLDALGSHVPQLLPVRILLSAAEADARRVLGDDNDAGKYLSHSGEAVLNTEGGRVEANEPFRVAFFDEKSRIERLRQLRILADNRGFTRRLVVFEGNSMTPLSEIDSRIFFEELRTADNLGIVRLRVACPMTLSGNADIILRREGGANLLIVARNSVDNQNMVQTVADDKAGIAQSIFGSIIASLSCSNFGFEIIDFMPADDSLELVLRNTFPQANFRIRRRRELIEVLKSYREEVASRISEDKASNTPMVLAIYGLHRARDFDTSSIDYDPAEDLVGTLTEILRNGPEVGVHVVLWTENIAGALRHVGSEAIRECAWRVAGRMSIDDSESLIGSPEAASIREHQVIIVNDDIGIFSRCSAYGLPSDDWVKELTNLSNK
jgi:hypothetical protein